MKWPYLVIAHLSILCSVVWADCTGMLTKNALTTSESSVTLYTEDGDNQAVMAPALNNWEYWFAFEDTTNCGSIQWHQVKVWLGSSTVDAST